MQRCHGTLNAVSSFVVAGTNPRDFTSVSTKSLGFQLPSKADENCGAHGGTFRAWRHKPRRTALYYIFLS
jgi:hypothetical protein